MVAVNAGPVNAMSVDVEDYFQVSAFEGLVPREAWDRQPRRVEANTHAVLDLFAEAGVRATFFTLGWVAQRHPGLVRRICEEGHELASHGWEHVRATEQDRRTFFADVSRTKALLEDLSGVVVRGYRAASYSIVRRNWWAFEALAEAGYHYSSSVYPIHHDLYGVPDAPLEPFRPDNADILEIPVSVVEVAGWRLPAGGGGFFRLYPYAFSRWAIRCVNRAGRRLVFYFHPWEIDPEQPLMAGASRRSRLRHYLNLKRMRPRLARLLRDFRWDRMDRVFPIDEESRRHMDRAS